MAIPPTGAAVRLTPRNVTTRAVRVPLTFALATSAAIVRAVPLLLVDLGTEEGLIGRTYLFCYTPSGARAIAEHIREALELALGKPTTPLDLAQFLQRRFALLGVTGTVRMALSAIDMAFWDAIAQSFGRPLSHLLGGSPRPLPAYDSRGLGLMAPAALASEAEKLLAKGLRALKLSLHMSHVPVLARALLVQEFCLLTLTLPLTCEPSIRPLDVRVRCPTTLGVPNDRRRNADFSVKAIRKII